MSQLERPRSQNTLTNWQPATLMPGKKCKGQAPSMAVLKDEHGQALIWLAMMLFGGCLLFGLCAYALDVGHALLVRKQLQASADAAALAAAWHLTDGTYATVAQTYSDQGTLNGYGYTVETPVITAKCSTTVATQLKVPCGTYGNMVTVQETAVVKSFFAQAIGHPTLTVTTTSAASKGANPTPYNIAIILDTTNSMNNYDSNCGATQEACAEGAIAKILNGLDPTQDRVALFTFPAMEVGSADNDTDCSGNQATGEPYTFPYTDSTSMATMPYTTTTEHRNRNGTITYTYNTVQTTYEIAGFETGYKSSYTATSLSTSGDPLVNAIGQTSGCSGLVPNDTQNTYFAATIYAAQAALVAEQAANPGSSNAMIIISDGNATANNTGGFNDMATGTAATTSCPADPGGSQTCEGASSAPTYTYPSLAGQCGQAVIAANAATGAGTLVFTIAYGSPSTSAAASGGSVNNGNCESDVTASNGTVESAYPNITPCQDMQDMSSGWLTGTTSNFFSDPNDGAQGDPNCKAVGPAATVNNLNDIADLLVSELTKSRLLPPNTP
jgi:Flp pilus assembly protein TadG